MPTQTNYRPLMQNLIDSLRVKEAAAKGETTHPSQHVDNNTHAPTTGARFAENTADMKNRPEGPTTDEMPDAKYQSGTGSQDQHQYNIGVQTSGVGEDSAVEDDYKGTKDDPGTTHPADAQGDAKGEKYSAYLKMPIDKLAAFVAENNNDILARIIAKQAGAPAPAADAAPRGAANSSTATIDESAVQKAAQDGYKAASQASALDTEARTLLYETVRDAELAAEKVAAMYYARADALYKSANDMPPGAMPAGEGPPMGGGAGLPPGGPPPSPGGPPPLPGGEPDGDEGDMGGDPIQELLAVCEELGIDPEELVAAAHAGKGPGAAIAPGDAPAVGAKAASAGELKRMLKSRGIEPWAPTTSFKQAKLRNSIRSYVAEVMGK